MAKFPSPRIYSNMIDEKCAWKVEDKVSYRLIEIRFFCTTFVAIEEDIQQTIIEKNASPVEQFCQSLEHANHDFGV